MLRVRCNGNARFELLGLLDIEELLDSTREIARWRNQGWANRLEERGQ